MKVISNVLLALFRPAKGIDGLGSSIRWMWMAFLGLLIVTVAVESLVVTPIRLGSEAESVKAMMEADLASASDADRAMIEQEMQSIESIDSAETEGVVLAASMIFGSLGAAATMLLTALFFFIAGKKVGSPAPFSTMLGVAGLATVPGAVRNILQTVNTASTGAWTAHQGLSSLVVPVDPAQAAPVLPYALLSQIDIWAIWGVLLILGAITATTIGFSKKRALVTTLLFVGLSVLVRVLPQIVSMILVPSV